MRDFKSTKEIYEYLISGGVIVHNEESNIMVRIENNGNLTQKHSPGNWQRRAWSFDCPSLWSKYIEEKPKKKYWRWLAKVGLGTFKTAYFVDEEGMTDNGYSYINKRELISKFENEFIEV